MSSFFTLVKSETNKTIDHSEWEWILRHFTDVVVQLDSSGYPFVVDFVKWLCFGPLQTFLVVSFVYAFIITIVQFEACASKGCSAFNRKLCFTLWNGNWDSHTKLVIISTPSAWCWDEIHLPKQHRKKSDITGCRLFTESSLRHAVKLPCKFIWDFTECVCVCLCKKKSSWSNYSKSLHACVL